jgi:hypothetical protein
MQQLLESQVFFTQNNGRLVPDFINDLPSHLEQDDIDFLAKKNALVAPEVSLPKMLLMSYIVHAHAFLPFLDLKEFLHAMFITDGFHKLSLLLFQAVMFVGVHFIHFKYLRDVGYSTRMDAENEFFQRARLLYEFNYGSDRIFIV